MPTINIPPVIRFVLYLIGAIALLTVTYAVDKDWAGDAEIRFVTGLAALLQLLAAAKTNLSGNAVVEVKEAVVEGDPAEIEVIEDGYVSWPIVALVVIAVFLLLILIGAVNLHIG